MEQLLRRKHPGEPADGKEIIGRIAAVIVGLLVVGIVAIGFVAPLIRSFSDWQGAPLGVQNYGELFAHLAFQAAWQNSLRDLLVIGVGGLLLCVGLALMLCPLRRPLRYAALVALFVPLCCPGAWQQLTLVFTGDRYGLANGLLLQWGLIDEPIFFAYSDWAGAIVRLTQLWRSLGPGVLILMAGLDGVRPGAYRESRRRGITTRSAAAWEILLPRMRVPLMLAAGAMVMGAMDTWEVARFLTGDASDVTPLWGYVAGRYASYDTGFASAAAVVTQLLTLGMLMLLCGGIFLLTRRPDRARLAGTEAPEEGEGLPYEPDGWRHPMRIAGVAVMTLLCLTAGLALLMLINRAFMPLDEIFQYPPKFFVRRPMLENFSDVSLLIGNSGFHPWKNFGKALMCAIPLGVLGTVVGWLAGHALSCRRSQAVRWGLVVCLLLVALCSPMAEMMGQQWRFNAIPGSMPFVEVLYVFLWVLTPVSMALGLSMRWLLRGDRQLMQRRVIIVAAGYAALLLLLCWRGTVGEIYQAVAAGGVARAGAAAAVSLLDSLCGLFAGVPMVMGLFQLCSGAGETFPLYQGEIR